MKFKTSGSTGDPKFIDLPESDLIASALTTIKFFGLNNSSILACPLSTRYIAGKMMEIRANLSGARLILEEPSNQPFINADFSDVDQIDLLALVPSQVPSFLSNNKLNTLTRNLIIGGAPLDKKVEEKLMLLPVNTYITYGMTETASHVALRKVGEEYYHALPGIEFDVDADKRLIIKSAERSFGSLLTNDIVDLKNSSEFIWKGRKDNVVNSGGIKLYPEILEAKIKNCMELSYFFAGVPSKKWGTELWLIIEDPDNMVDETSVLSKIELCLDKLEMPKKILKVKCFDRTETGKIKRLISKYI